MEKEFDIVNKSSKNRMKIQDQSWFLTGLSSLIIILLTLLVGYLILLAIDPANSGSNFVSIIFYGLFSKENALEVFYSASFLILIGIGFCFTFRAGFLNLGAFGQLMAGIFLSFILSKYFSLAWYYLILIAGLGGAVIGLIPGLLKTYLHVNENLSALVLDFVIYGCLITVSKNINSDSQAALASSSYLPSLGLDKIDPMFNIGIFIAVILAIIVFFVLRRSTFGFSLRTISFNPKAAELAGVNVKRETVLAFILSGFFIGIGGYMLFSSQQFNLTETGSSLLYGAPMSFEVSLQGLAVSLLAGNNPLGCILTAVLISGLNFSKVGLPNNASVSSTYVFISLLIYFMSFSSVLKSHFSFFKKGKAFSRIVRRNIRKGKEAVSVEANSETLASKKEMQNDIDYAKKIAVNNPVPAEEHKANHQAVKDMYDSWRSAKEKEKSEVSNGKIYIYSSPFTRDLEGYNPDNLENLDDAELTRVTGHDDSSKKEGK